MTYPTAVHADASRMNVTSIFGDPGLLGPRPFLLYASAVAGLVGLILAGMAFGEILEHVLQDGWLGTDVDRAISRFTVGHRAGWLTELMRQVTGLGGSTVMVAVVFLTTAGMLLLRRSSLATVMAVAALGSSGLAMTMKTIIERPRPSTNGDIMFASSSSFPSGHTLESAAVYGALVFILGSLIVSRRRRLGIWAAGVTLALAVGASRVYLGVHWASDVAAGWLIGFTLLASVVALVFLDRHVAQFVLYDSRLRTLAARGSILGIVAFAAAAAFLLGVDAEL